MKEREVTVENTYGLHARAAAILVTQASKFKSRIELEKDGQVVDGKSIMGILMLAAAKGSNLKLRADGEDEDNAIEELSTLLSTNLETESKEHTDKKGK